MVKRTGADDAIRRLEKVHAGRYFYYLADYQGTRGTIDIGCPRCDRFFEQRYRVHLDGANCPHCRNYHAKSSVEAVETFRTVHGDRYFYFLVDYVSNREKVSIGCGKCDFVFEQRPRDHLSGQGCPRCGLSNIDPMEPCTLYLIRQSHPDCQDDWIKIGVTKKENFQERFREANGIESVAFQTWRFRHRRDALTAERMILSTYATERIKAPVEFSGSTECFPMRMRRRLLQALEALELEFTIL